MHAISGAAADWFLRAADEGNAGRRFTAWARCTIRVWALRAILEAAEASVRAGRRARQRRRLPLEGWGAGQLYARG